MKPYNSKNLFEFSEYLPSNIYLKKADNIIITKEMKNIIEDIKSKQIKENPYIFIFFLYLNKAHIENILYEEDIIISLGEEISKNLLYSLPLILLILDNYNKINFKYSFDFINNFNEYIKKETETWKKVILSKILVRLIDNYKGLDEYFNDLENKKII